MKDQNGEINFSPYKYQKAGFVEDWSDPQSEKEVEDKELGEIIEQI